MTDDDDPVVTDEGLRFFATIVTDDGTTAHREADDRRVLLSWLDAHLQAGATLQTLTMEATGYDAKRNMLAALRLGATRLP